MTIEEAINTLKSRASTGHPEENCSYFSFGASIQAVNEALDMAISALRAQQERENPKPLTPDELREMDQNSPPIWDSCLNEWCTVRWIAAAGCKGVSYIGGGCRPLESGRFYRNRPRRGEK